jgi:putative heme transporter
MTSQEHGSIGGAVDGSRLMMDAAPEAAFASAPLGTPAQPTPSRRAIAGRALVLVGVVLFVFGFVLPRLIDYDAVRAALAALTPGQLALLVAGSIVAYVAGAGPSRVLVPGLSWPRAVGSDLAARAVVSTVPGPTDVATRFVLYRQWSIPTDVASAGIALVALFETFSIFALPLIATAGVLVDRQPIQERPLLLALVGLVVLVAAAALLVSIVRSESLARKLGGWLDSMAQRIWRLFRKSPPTGIVEGILDLRERSKTILTQHGLRGFAAAVVARLAWFVVLEIALWCVGIGPDVLPPSAVLAAMAVVGIVSLVPITPGAVGVAEVAYIGILSSVAGSGMTEQLTAAVMLFRIAQWLAPIPIGWVLLLVLRRGHWGELLGGPAKAPTPSTS